MMPAGQPGCLSASQPVRIFFKNEQLSLISKKQKHIENNFRITGYQDSLETAGAILSVFFPFEDDKSEQPFT